MDRVLISIGPFDIYWYAVLIVAAIVLGVFLGSRQAEKNGLGKKFLSDLVYYLVLVGVLGARVYYVVFNLSSFDTFLDIFKVWEGGLAIYGGVIAGILFTIYYCKKHNKDALLSLDTIAPYLILGQAIGRWGNFINKEAYGTLTTYNHLRKLHIPKFIINGMYINGSYYLPTFFFESIWCLLGFIILLIMRSRNKYKDKGLLLFSYFIWYGIGRFFIEGLRTDSLYFGMFRISQIVSIVLIIIGIVGIVYIKKKIRNK